MLKKFNPSLLYKSVPILALCVLGACANFSGDGGKVAASNENAATSANLMKAPSLSSALASVSLPWKPLFVAASASEEVKPVKFVPIVVPATVATASNAPISSPVPVTALRASDTAPFTAQLKMDHNLDSLKYAVYFEYASADLNPTGKAALEYLQAEAKIADKIEIIGRADPSGNTVKNEKLARARANTVRQELLKYGVAVKTINVKSFVALAKADNRVAYRQNLPADLSAASRRADVDMLVKPNMVSKLTVHSNFVAVPS